MSTTTTTERETLGFFGMIAILWTTIGRGLLMLDKGLTPIERTINSADKLAATMEGHATHFHESEQIKLDAKFAKLKHRLTDTQPIEQLPKSA